MFKNLQVFFFEHFKSLKIFYNESRTFERRKYVKKIFLIGDSIRIGYDKFVKSSLENLAEIYFSEENNMYSTHVLRNVHNMMDWHRVYDVDAVHFNAGLWDTVRIYGDDPLVSPENYAENIRRIVKRIKFLFPDAKIIFATSTPCLEEDFFTDFEYRTNSDIELYNKIASEIVLSEGGIVNDLYSAIKDRPDLHSDQTHCYTAEGTEILGNKVVSCLCEALKLDKSLVIDRNGSDFVLDWVKNVKNDKDAYEKIGHIYKLKEN